MKRKRNGETKKGGKEKIEEVWRTRRRRVCDSVAQVRDDSLYLVALIVPSSPLLNSQPATAIIRVLPRGVYVLLIMPDISSRRCSIPLGPSGAPHSVPFPLPRTSTLAISNSLLCAHACFNSPEKLSTVPPVFLARKIFNPLFLVCPIFPNFPFRRFINFLNHREKYRFVDSIQFIPPPSFLRLTNFF